MAGGRSPRWHGVLGARASGRGRIARFDEIADALEMTRSELASIWRGLPIDDATIAKRFGITRQQVINLRKSARTRLSRRLGR